MNARSRLHPVFQQILETSPFVPIPADGESHPLHLEIDPERPDVVRQPAGADGVDGWDRAHVCTRHQWASEFSVWSGIPPCPLCEAEAEAEPGRRRYAAVHARLSGC